MCRGILRFADAKPLGERGLRWLKIHMANMTGYDKASFDEREAYTMEHLEDIYDSADHPLDVRSFELSCPSVASLTALSVTGQALVAPGRGSLAVSRDLLRGRQRPSFAQPGRVRVLAPDSSRRDLQRTAALRRARGRSQGRAPGQSRYWGPAGGRLFGSRGDGERGYCARGPRGQPVRQAPGGQGDSQGRQADREFPSLARYEASSLTSRRS